MSGDLRTPRLERARSGHDPVRLPGRAQAGDVVGIVLYEELEKDSGATAEAYLRMYSPATAGYVTTTILFPVKDIRQVGYYGTAGKTGAAVLRRTDAAPGWIGEICDLRCP